MSNGMPQTRWFCGEVVINRTIDSHILAAHRQNSRMKLSTERPFANPAAAARKLVEIASGIEPVQVGRIFIELVDEPFLKAGGMGTKFRAGIAASVDRGWLELHESGTFVRLQRDSLM